MDSGLRAGGKVQPGSLSRVISWDDWVWREELGTCRCARACRGRLSIQSWAARHEFRSS
jgi:hypothetical protein